MKLKTSIAALLLASALPVAAQAAGLQGNLSTSYTNISGGGTDIWNVDGALSTGLGGNWGGELTGGYHDFSGNQGGNFGGALSYGGHDYRLALSGNYFSAGGAELTNVGLGGEWFASSRWTLQARGGWFHAGGGGVDGGYVGGGVKFYATPDFVLNAGVDYLDASGSVTSEDVSAEWLISRSTPISIFGGYQHTDVGGGSTDAFFVGLRIYTNDPAGGALADRQRGGNLGYLDGLPYLGKVL